mmetsp:Transcript_20258/g.19576  ORF Transcript_20258/g.19576 Transcript_20258/m.19576 type:complete len:205 (-) Transcript_20258:109-723(-)
MRVAVAYSGHHRVDQLAGYFLSESVVGLFVQPIYQLPPPTQFQNQKYFLFDLEELMQAEDVRVIQPCHDGYFYTQLGQFFRLELFFVESLQGELELGGSVHTHLDRARDPYAKHCTFFYIVEIVNVSTGIHDDDILTQVFGPEPLWLSQGVSRCYYSFRMACHTDFLHFMSFHLNSAIFRGITPHLNSQYIIFFLSFKFPYFSI